MRFPSLRRIVPALLTVLLFVPVAAFAQSVELRWSFEAGETLRYSQTQTTVNAGPMGQMTQTQTTVMAQDVLDVADDGAADVRVTYESMHSVQDGPMGRAEYDSTTDDEPSDPSMAVSAALVGETFEMTLGPRGDVRDVRGLDQMLAKVMDALPDQGPGAAEARAAIESTFGEEQMAAMMQQGMHMLPEGEVEPGAEWSESLVIPLPFGTLRSDYVYRLEAVDRSQGRPIAHISLRGTTGQFEPDEDNPLGAMISITGGEITGDLRFDVDAGRLIDATGSSDLSMGVMGQTMTLTMEQEMRLLDG